MPSFQEIYVEPEKDYSTSTWVNKTHYTAKFRILTTKKTGIKQAGVAFREIILIPESRITLPSEYDDAIRTIGPNGQVVGGLCPWLTKVEDKETPELHSCLDFEGIKEQIELEALALKINKDKALEEAKKVQAETKTKNADNLAKARAAKAERAKMLQTTKE